MDYWSHWSINLTQIAKQIWLHRHELQSQLGLYLIQILGIDLVLDYTDRFIYFSKGFEGREMVCELTGREFTPTCVAFFQIKMAMIRSSLWAKVGRHKSRNLLSLSLSQFILRRRPFWQNTLSSLSLLAAKSFPTRNQLTCFYSLRLRLGTINIISFSII